MLSIRFFFINLTLFLCKRAFVSPIERKCSISSRATPNREKRILKRKRKEKDWRKKVKYHSKGSKDRKNYSISTRLIGFEIHNIWTYILFCFNYLSRPSNEKSSKAQVGQVKNLFSLVYKTTNLFYQTQTNLDQVLNLQFNFKSQHWICNSMPLLAQLKRTLMKRIYYLLSVCIIWCQTGLFIQEWLVWHYFGNI